MAGRDRLRELLDAVLDEENADLDAMARGAHSSPFHMSRVVGRATGEPPVAMRRRVMLERAAWNLARGATVTDAAWEAGYESVEGFSRAFSRAFGRPPGQPGASHLLPAPNGIHFHPPFNLWVRSEETTMTPLTEVLVRHDLDDTSYLLELAEGVPDEELRTVRLPGAVILAWDGVEDCLRAVLQRLVFSKRVWLAAIDGADAPEPDPDGDVATLIERHRQVAEGWLAAVRGIEERGAWNDVLIDALCEPPESFVLSGVVAHVLTYSAMRRQLARVMFRLAGVDVDEGDPIMWQRR